MTNVKWTREMYRDLEEYLSRKKPLAEIAEILKVEKKGLPYRISTVNEGKDYLTLWDEEFHLLDTNTNVDTFLTKFRGLYGKHRTVESGIFHWNHREEYLKKWKNETKKVHDIKKPANPEIKVPRTDAPLPDIYDEVSETKREIRDILREILQVQRDTYTLFKALNDRAIAKTEGK